MGLGTHLPARAGWLVAPACAVWAALLPGLPAGLSGQSGSFTEYPTPTAVSYISRFTPGPDGALWFAEPSLGGIRQITTAGVITEYASPCPTTNPGGATTPM